MYKCTHNNIWYIQYFLTGVPKSPVLTYMNTLNEILVSWSPVSSDEACGPVSYNVTVKPSHGMVMRVNDTAYNITGLHNNTDYTITVYATNSFGDGESGTVTVKTLGSYVATVYSCIYKSMVAIQKHHQVFYILGSNCKCNI